MGLIRKLGDVAWVGFCDWLQAISTGFPSGRMIPSRRRLPGVVAGLEGLGIKHMSASLSGASSAPGMGGALPVNSGAQPGWLQRKKHSFQAAAGADPVGTALCGRMLPMCLPSSVPEMSGSE